MMTRSVLAAMALTVVAVPAFAADKDKVHHLALQISDPSPERMNTVLNNAANASRYYADKGEMLEIKVVAYSGGLTMLRDDKSPVKERLKMVAQNNTHITFEACNNTLEGMAKREGKKPEEITLVPGTKIVPSGVVELLELNEQGWTIVQP